MIQRAINQWLTMGAAFKKASDVTKEKQAKAEEKQQKAIEKQQKAVVKEQAAKQKAMQRMASKVEAKWAQNKDYQSFREGLINQSKTGEIPEALSRLAYGKWAAADKAVKEAGVDLSDFSPDAQAAIIREVNK